MPRRKPSIRDLAAARLAGRVERQTAERPLCDPEEYASRYQWHPFRAALVEAWVEGWLAADREAQRGRSGSYLKPG